MVSIIYNCTLNRNMYLNLFILPKFFVPYSKLSFLLGANFLLLRIHILLYNRPDLVSPIENEILCLF